VYRALLSAYRALLSVYRALLSVVNISNVRELRALVSVYVLYDTFILVTSLDDSCIFVYRAF